MSSATAARRERLRPRLVVAHFRQWTARELDLQREAASASELRENMVAEPGYYVPDIDWRRTARRVLTLEWLDGIKLNDRDALIAAGQDCKASPRPWSGPSFARRWSTASSTPTSTTAICSPSPTGGSRAIDFGIMGRIDRRARVWLAEILYGLITGNYRRVAEIHFEAQYVPPHHNVEEFATALRAAGEPIRGLPVKDISVGRMLESLFSITRDFDMPTQPHLLLLQKTMVMNEGVATALDPDINMWETAEPFLKEWIRSELGPEAYYADRHHRACAGGEEDPRADRPPRRILSAARRRASAAAAARHCGHRAPATGGAMRWSASSRPRSARCCCLC